MPLIIPTNSISAVGYDVANSLRFDDGSTDYLSFTPGDGSRRKFTFSAWVKRANLTGSNMCIFSPGHKSTSAGNDRLDIEFLTNSLRITQAVGGLHSSLDVRSSQLFRDVSAWYHIVVAIDTEQATASDRVKMYSNGTQITDFNLATYPSLNADLNANNYSAVAYNFSVGGFTELGFFDGYMAETVFIDGQQLDPTSFGEFDEDTGIWKPIDVSGLTFGTNGFYLDFENSGSLGADVSGNGNNFTVNNLTSIDQTTDTPTNNFATYNPLSINTSNGSWTDGNTGFTTGDASYRSTFSSIGASSGKYYMEVKLSGGTNYSIGVLSLDMKSETPNISYIGDGNCGTKAVGLLKDGNTTVNGSETSGFDSIASGDIVMIALDLDNGFVYFGKNGTWGNSGDPTSGASGTGARSITVDTNEFWGFGASIFSNTIYGNFGNPPFTISSGNSDGNGYGNFEYSVPSGYYALNTKNLAEYG